MFLILNSKDFTWYLAYKCLIIILKEKGHYLKSRLGTFSLDLLASQVLRMTSNGNGDTVLEALLIKGVWSECYSG